MAYSADFRNKVVLISVPSSIFLAVSYINGAKKQRFQTFLNAILQRFNAMLQPWKMKIPSIKNLLLLLICP